MRFASCSIAFLLALAPAVRAQSATQAFPLQTTSGTGFTGAPYSGKETTVKVQRLQDGALTTQTFVELLWRDAEGRTRRELIRHKETGAEYRSVIVTDPVAGVYLKWTAGDEATRRVVSIWPVTGAQRVTSPPQAAPLPTGEASTAPQPGFEREILTPQYINGVYAQGSRTTRTIRLDEERGNRAIEVTNELWISPDLRIIVRHIVDDPRSGKTTTDVTDVVRGDPDPALFQALAGYEVVDRRTPAAR